MSTTVLNIDQLHNVITDHFSGPRRAIGRVCVCLSVCPNISTNESSSDNNNNLRLFDLWQTAQSAPTFATQGETPFKVIQGHWF